MVVVHRLPQTPPSGSGGVCPLASTGLDGVGSGAGPVFYLRRAAMSAVVAHLRRRAGELNRLADRLEFVDEGDDCADRRRVMYRTPAASASATTACHGPAPAAPPRVRPAAV